MSASAAVLVVDDEFVVPESCDRILCCEGIVVKRVSNDNDSLKRPRRTDLTYALTVPN